MNTQKWVEIVPGVRMRVERGVVQLEVFDVSRVRVSQQDICYDNDYAPEYGTAFATRDSIIETSKGAVVGISLYTPIEKEETLTEEQFDAMTDEEVILYTIEQRNKPKPEPRPELLEIIQQDLDLEAELGEARGQPLPTSGQVASDLVRILIGEATLEQIMQEREKANKHKDKLQ